MGIIQEDRLYAPQPEVTETKYGAQYVKAATESPVDTPSPVSSSSDEGESSSPVNGKKRIVVKQRRNSKKK